MFFLIIISVCKESSNLGSQVGKLLLSRVAAIEGKQVQDQAKYEELSSTQC